MIGIKDKSLLHPSFEKGDEIEDKSLLHPSFDKMKR